MNLSRNLASLAPAAVAPATPSAPRLPAGRITTAVRRGLVALGWPNANTLRRRDLAAALRWLAS